MMEDVIKVKNLSKAYGDLKAVDNFTFSVKRGTVFGLLGANGAGKSTTIDCVLGTKKADSGVVSVLGVIPIARSFLSKWVYSSKSHIIRKTLKLVNCVR